MVSILFVNDFLDVDDSVATCVAVAIATDVDISSDIVVVADVEAVQVPFHLEKLYSLISCCCQFCCQCTLVLFDMKKLFLLHSF